MRRRSAICVLLVAMLSSMSSMTAFAADSTDLQLYMGIKTKYVGQNTTTSTTETTTSDTAQAGNTANTSAGYTFTTKDSDELVAQALSDNNPEVTSGFIRQLPMRDLIKVLDTVKSAADILKERNRDDLLAKAYKGGYIAPEHTVVSTDSSGAGATEVATKDGTVPLWATTGDIGLFGDKLPVPLGGKINVLSVYGETYVIGNNSYDASETVFDTTKDNKVYALFNGYVSYIGSNVIEFMSYDQQVMVRYRGVSGLEGTVAGTAYSQGAQIGTTSDFTLGVSLRVATVQRNLLQVYPESLSKDWYTAWSTKNAARSQQLVLNAGDSNYHVTASELPANSADSYTNPEDFGVTTTTTN